MTNPFGTPQEEDIFDLTAEGVELGEETITPEGEYVGKCVDVTKGMSKAGNPMWIWDFTIVEGSYAGEDFRLHTAITPAALWKLTETLAAMGLVDEAGKPIKFSKGDVINTLVTMEIVPDEYNGRKKASLNKISPYAGGVGKKHTGTMPGVPF